MSKKTKERTLSKVIKTNSDMLKFAWGQKQGRRYIALRAVMSLLGAMFSAFYAIMPGIIVNELLEGRRSNYLIFYVSILSFATIINFFVNRQLNLFLNKERNESELLFKSEFYSFTLGMDYETLESPEMQQLRRRAVNALENVYGYINTMAEFFSAIFSICAMSTIIITLNPVIILLVVLCAAINFVVAGKINYSRYLLGKKSR